MDMYSCEPCMMFFNGKIPYESHMASKNHKKKANEPTSIVQDFRNCNFNPSSWEQEPFITCLEKGYKCTLCKVYLNSVDQVRCHIGGAKHLKAKASFESFPNSNALPSPNQSIDQVDGYSPSVALTGDSRFQFPIDTDEMQELVEDIKVFKPNDEIVFSSI